MAGSPARAVRPWVGSDGGCVHDVPCARCDGGDGDDDGCVVLIPVLCSVFLLWLFFTRDPNLQFVEAPALAPPEVHIDAGMMQQYEEELQQASAVPLPLDGDDDL